MLGHRVSHYRITGKLGIGGMGIVYEAEDVRLPRKVALKFLPEESADDPDAERRFQREADTIAQLNHPNICTIYEIDRHEGRAFIAMECVEGAQPQDLHGPARALDERNRGDCPADRRGPRTLPMPRASSIATSSRATSSWPIERQVKVLDFGLARRFKTDETHELELGLDGSTIPGRPMGTANYMAPERILQLPLDPRSDLFSLGVVIYEMATGQAARLRAPPRRRPWPTCSTRTRRR